MGGFITYNEQHFYRGQHHYFMTRHDGSVPRFYLSLATIDQHQLDLSAWGATGRVLCKVIVDTD